MTGLAGGGSRGGTHTGARPGTRSGRRTEKSGRHAPRVPFALLVTGLIVGGLALLLALNTASAANELRRQSLSSRDATIANDVQQLQNEVAASAAPANLAQAAAALGMVPAGNPAFIVEAKNGSARLRGSPGAATAAPIETVPSATPHATVTKKATTKKATKKSTKKVAKKSPKKSTTSTKKATKSTSPKSSRMPTSSKTPTAPKSTSTHGKHRKHRPSPTPTPTPTPTLTLPGGNR